MSTRLADCEDVVVDIEYLCSEASLHELRKLSKAAGEAYLAHSPRAVPALRVLALGGVAPKTAAALLWSVAVRVLDDCIDGDVTGSHEPEWYLERVELTLQATKHAPRGRGVEADMVSILLVAAIRHARAINRPIDQAVADLWPLYMADVRRQIWRQAFPAAHVQAGVDQSNAMAQAITAYLKGAPYHEAFALRLRLIDTLNPLVNLASLPQEIARSQAHIAHETLAAAGLDVDRLTHCGTWQELAEVPGFVEWYYDTLLNARDQWEATGKADWRAVNGLLRPSLAGRLYTHRRIHAIDTAFAEALRRFDTTD